MEWCVKKMLLVSVPTPGESVPIPLSVKDAQSCFSKFRLYMYLEDLYSRGSSLKSHLNYSYVLQIA